MLIILSPAVSNEKEQYRYEIRVSREMLEKARYRAFSYIKRIHLAVRER